MERTLPPLPYAMDALVPALSKETLDVFRFWVVGSLSGSSGGALGELALYMGLGLLLAVGVSRSLNAVALGDDTARALGTRLAATRLMTMAAVTLLCGAAVAAAGPIGFVGLIVPHAARA